MLGRVWRDRTAAVVAVVLALALVAVSFGPWYGLSLAGLPRLTSQGQRNAWQVSGLWMLAVVLGAVAGCAAAATDSRRRGWQVIAILAFAGAVLVLLPPGGPLCACGAPGGEDFGWFAYAPLNSEPVVSFGPHWARWLAGGLLGGQVLVAAVQLRYLRSPRTVAE